MHILRWESPQHLATLVRAAREERQLRQEDVAFAASVSRRFVIQLEQGKELAQLGPTLRVLAALGLACAVGPRTEIRKQFALPSRHRPPVPRAESNE